MAKIGPPVTYRSDLGEILIDVAKGGGHQDQMFIALGEALGKTRPISPDTFARWRKEYPEFEEAYQASRVASKAFYENALLRGAMGLVPGFNATAMAMIMNNKFPEEYKRNSTGHSTEPNQTTVNIVQLSQKEWFERVQQKQDFLRQHGQLIGPEIIDVEAE